MARQSKFTASFKAKVAVEALKDNIWIERFWRTVKQEYVYINPTDSVVELRQGISDYIEFYNYERPHQSVGEVLPARSYGLIA
ncbi:MAG: integrase core domain-containing protein [Porphyromonadaceae bacterium]|nr:integrase core domain-containing protein [Porphyromonadaceae bacterium]